MFTPWTTAPPCDNDLLTMSWADSNMTRMGSEPDPSRALCAEVSPSVGVELLLLSAHVGSQPSLYGLTP
ncbi:unnamed protein product [Arctogadus glacialis]